MAKLDPQIAAHLEWIGFVRPTGLVVSAPALVKAGALLNRRDAEGQQLLRGCVEEPRHGRDVVGAATEPEPRLPDFRAFASSVLGWNFSPAGYAGTEEAPIPPDLEAVLPEGGEVLRPDFAVRADPVRGERPRGGPNPQCGKAQRVTARRLRSKRRRGLAPNVNAPRQAVHRPGSFSFASASRARTSTT